MKRKQNMQIFKLEERVLFDGAAAAEIVAAVNNATATENADSASDDSEEGKEEKFVQNTVQNAGPVEAPAPEANVQNAGEGIPQADAALNDPAEALIQGNADFTQVTDPGAEFSGEMADFIHAADADSAVPQDAAELIVLDSEAADQINPEALDGKNVLILEGDSDVSDQIENWMEEHSDQKIESIQLVTDSDTLAAEISDADGVDVVSVQDFQTDADAGDDMVIVPDTEANITVEPAAEPIPEELTSDAESDRHELVILNSTTADIDNVLEQLGDSRDILIIDSSSDAFEQISDYLEHSDTPYDAVHILTHGNDSGVVLGSDFISDANDFSIFSDHIAADGDLMFYGCNMASSAAGQSFLQGIADATGADVAASNNITGSADLGGDWNLEYSIGEITADSITLDASWNHRLAAYTIDGIGGSPTNFENLNALLSNADLSDNNLVITYQYTVDTTDNSYADPWEILTSTHATTVSIINDNSLGGNATLELSGGMILDGVDLTINGMIIEANITDSSASTLTLINANVDGGISFHVSGSKLNLDNSSVTGTLTMGNGTELHLNTDAEIGTIDLQDGSTLNYTNAITLTGGIDFHSGAKIYVEGDPDPGAGIFTLDPTHNLTITDTLTMESYTTLNLNTDVVVGTILLKPNSTFNYTSGVSVTLNGGIDSYIDLTFNHSEFTIRPYDDFTPNSAITLHAGAMTVAANSKLNLIDTAITVADDSPAVTAIINNGTLNFYGTNTITFNNSKSAIYSGVTNTGTVNIVKTGDDPTALTVDFSSVDNQNTFEKNGLTNNGASAEINITVASLTVRSSTNAQQKVYAVNNTQGKVTVTKGGVILNTYGTAGAAVYNAKDQLVTIGTNGAVDGSQIIMNTPGSNENYAVYNNGTLKIYNSYVAATGTGSIGLFNGTDGTVTFKVDVTPNQYLTADDIASLSGSTDLVGDVSKLVYSITGGAYSVYNQKSFTVTVPGLTYSGTIAGTEVKDIPVAALNGNVGNYTPASGSSPVLNLTKITINGNLLQSGNSSVTLTDVVLNGNLTNDRGNVFISGYFGNSGELSVGTNTGSYLNGIVIKNDYNRDSFPGAFGNVYIGTEDAVTFNSQQSYTFVNFAGEMFIYNFSDLSSESNPIAIYNVGVFKMESDSLYDLYVTGANYATYLNSAEYTTPHAAGITDAGILNFNRNSYVGDSTYSKYYPVKNEMVLTNLNIRNTQNQAAAVSNYAGVLTITGGSLQASYSGIDLLSEVYWDDKTTTRFEFTVMTPVTTLTDLTKIAGGAYSIRNTGELTMTAENVEGGTLLTNKADFSVSYSGDYVALGNYSMTFTVRERYDSSSSIMNRYTLTATNGVQTFSRSWDATTQTASPLTPAQFSAYSVSGDDISTRSKIAMSESPDVTVIVSTSNPTINDFYFSGYAVPAVGSVQGVAFQVAAGTGTKTAIQNWGTLSVSEINADPDYRFTGFTVSIDNGRTIFWDSPYASLSHFTIEGDYTIGFDLPASQVLTAPSQSRGSMILRGVETVAESGLYVGRLMVDGGRYVVYTTQSLTLENFSVLAADSDAILNAGTLLVFNGTGSETTGWTGPSNAVITATGHAGIVNEGRVRMINGAIKDSETAIQQEFTGLLSVINSTLYNNTTGIVSSLGAPSDDGMNFEVIDTTIVSKNAGSIGIQLNAKGQLDLVNTIILVKGYKGLVNDVGATVDEHGSSNIYGNGEADTLAKMTAVYGTGFDGIDGSYDTNLNVLYLAPGSTALSGGVAVGYTVSSDGVYEFKFGGDASSAAVKVTKDKGGNMRGEAIGSYVLTGTPTPTVTIIVNTVKDSDANPDDEQYSLRYVLDYLMSGDNTTGATTVEFDWDALKAEAEAASADQLLFIVDSGTLEISGNNDAHITEITIDVSGNTTGLALTIGTDQTTASLFTISGMKVTLTGADAGTFTVNGSGKAEASVGVDGAAFQLENVSGTALTLNNTTVQDGVTTGNGGAVYLAGSNASLTVNATTFSNNTAARGGAVYLTGSDASLTVDAARFLNNSAAYGGAIYNAGGKVLQAADSTAGTVFRGNTATQGGGAIYNAGGTVTLGTTSAKTTFQGNAAGLDGGAIYVAGGSVSITGNLTGNGEKGTTTTQDGGAIYVTGGSVTITGNLTGNKAAHDGGAIYNGGGSVTITGNLTGNEAANEDGGAIYNIGGSVKVTGNLADNTAAIRGGAIYTAGGSVTVIGDLTGNEAVEGSVAYVDDGMVQLGDLDHYITLKGNSGSLVVQNAGDVLLMNASVTENDPGSDSLFMIGGGTFTLLNTTVTGNNGTGILELEQSGNSTVVQIGDSTVYETGAVITVNNGTLNLINSIVIVNNNDFAVNKNIQSLVNEKPENIFTYKNGAPEPGDNGTLKIKASGLAGKGGVMVGYKNVADTTVLYYTTDGNSWKNVYGDAGSGVTAVKESQNGATRLFKGYNLLNIGAYSLSSSLLSLVVTNSGDESVDGETTLREALDYAAFLGGNQRVTFKVKEVYLNSTITISSSVNVVGGGVSISAADSTFLGDSIFVLTGGADVAFRSLTIAIPGNWDPPLGVRGIRVDNADLTLKSVTIQNGVADGSVSGSEARGGAIYVKAGSSVTGSGVTLRDNQAGDGAAIYAVDAPVKLSNFQIIRNIATDTDGSVITSSNTTAPVDGTGLHLLLENGVINSNTAQTELIFAEGDAALISVSAANNQMGGPLLQVRSADIVNSSLTGDPSANSNYPLVYAADTLNVANSIIVTSSAGRKAVEAGQIYSAYSIYSGTLQNAAVNVENLTGMGFRSVFTGGLSNGRLVIGDDSPAAVGVWTQYNPATREIAYSVRPQGIWTEQYKPENMQWRYLGGGAAMYNPSLLVGSSDDPSIGAYWITSSRNHPDFGPGVNAGMVNPGYNGGFGSDWGYSSVVNSYLMNPSSSLSDASESGMGWYATLLSELFGFRSQQTGILSVSGGAPGNELGLSVDGSVEGFEEFQEAPYRAEDGTPLSQEEMNAIRTAALTGRMPAESIHLNDAVHEQVASTLRSAEPFKDSFDRALDALLGLDA